MTNHRLLTLAITLASSAIALPEAGAALPPDYRNDESARAQAGAGRPVSARNDCQPGRTDFDQDINNVRARLLTGGDVWWNGSEGRYVVPKPPPGDPLVSSLFAGAVWLGGFDAAGNLKLAAQDYGRSSGAFDYYPGPLDPETGEISASICSNWDRFFVVNAAEIREHQRLFAASVRGEIVYTADMIPNGVKGWPARGNPYFEEVHGFAPPNTQQGLAGFYDFCDDDAGVCNIDGLYDPLAGDLPIIEIEGCEDFYNADQSLRDLPQFPDQMVFWIYNDNGNNHENSGANVRMEMEVQVQAFAYSTNDALNNMTFQRYKLINRGKDVLRDTYFGIWIDGDLGCYTDDFIGCDTSRSLAIYYNQDPVDGATGAVCPGGVNTYGTDVPIMGIDYFRGPKEFVTVFDAEEGDSIEVERELGMSSFTYFNNASVGAPPTETTDPTAGVAGQFYNYLSGRWRDGTPYTASGTGYQTSGPVTRYAFPSPPNDESATAWSMCSENLGEGDRRTIQASGPFTLRSGAVNELIVGVPWVPEEQTYPCPSLERLLAADDLAQNLFDACFDITDGPDAPDVDLIELDRSVTIVLTNDDRISNNPRLLYEERDLLAPDGVSDSTYNFEGYKVYQLADATVSVSELDDPTRARLIAQSDVRNGIGELYNWTTLENPLNPSRPVYEPVARVEASVVDEGVSTVIRVTDDQFAEGQDRRLINQKPYYFTAVAYAYNEYDPFDPFDGTGQQRPYLEGRNNIRTYTAVPRPIVGQRLVEADRAANVRRLDGVGTGPFFLDLAAGERERLLAGDSDERPLYQEGESPVVARTYNPFEVRDGTYRVEFRRDPESDDGEELGNGATWRLLDVDGEVLVEDQSFGGFNERIVGELGVSLSLGQVEEPGTNATEANGCIGYEVAVADGETPWLGAVREGDDRLGNPQVLNFVQNETSDESPASELDPNSGLTECFDREWLPFALTAPDNRALPPNSFITPMLTQNGSRLISQLDLADLNNVDVVFTDDKSQWSRCVVVETGTSAFTAPAGVETVGDADQFDLRDAPSVGIDDADGDGRPDPDGATAPDGSPLVGMGYFPGYALDVETGERLNIFFGENSAIRYNSDSLNPYNALVDAAGMPLYNLTGADMMFNPTDELVAPELAGTQGLSAALLGGHHFIYVTNQPYDECEEIRDDLSSSSSVRRRRGLSEVTYTSIPLSARGFKSYAEGLIPAETVVKLRVTNPYAVAESPTGANDGVPAYELTFEGVEAEEVPLSQADSILSFVKAVPNPYYGYSEYEINEFSNLVRITNLPARATVTIYSLDGKFIRQYTRAEEPPGVDINPDDPRTTNRAIRSRQIYPSLDWDLKNEEGVPVASGVYLVHVDAFDLGETTLKLFLLQRAFDPAGL